MEAAEVWRARGAKRGAARGQCGEKQGAGSSGVGREPPALRGHGPAADHGPSSGSGQVRAGPGLMQRRVRVPRRGRPPGPVAVGRPGSSHSLGRWCGGGSRQRGGRSRAAQRAAWPWHWQRLLLTPRPASPRGPRAPGGGDWPPRWPSGPLGTWKVTLWALPTPLARRACATVTSRPSGGPGSRQGPGQSWGKAQADGRQ